MSSWSAERMSRRGEFEARVVPSVDNTPRRRCAPDSWRHDDSSSFSSPTLSPVSPPPPPIRPVAVARRRALPSTALPPPPPPPDDVSDEDAAQRAWTAAVTHPADSWRRSWHARSAALAAPTHPELFNANNYDNQFAPVQRTNASSPKPLMSVTVNNNYLPNSQGPSKQKKKKSHRRRGSAGYTLASMPLLLPEELIHVRSAGDAGDQNSLARCSSAAAIGSREQTRRTGGGDSGGSGDSNVLFGSDDMSRAAAAAMAPRQRCNSGIAVPAGRFSSLARPESMETSSPPRPSSSAAAPPAKLRVRPRPLTPLPRSSIVVTGEAGPPAPTRRQWTALPSVRELLDGTAGCVDMEDPRSPPPSPARREFFVQLAVFQAEHAGLYPDWYADYRDKCH